MNNDECIHDLNEIKNYFLKNFEGTYPAGLDYAINMINSGDAVQYTLGYQDGFLEGKKICERPQGKWIEVPVKRDLLYYNGIKYTCSVCGEGNCYGKPPYCMYCGADMKGGAE